MSSISQIYSSYGDALAYSRDKYEDLYTTRARNASEFYNAFFHNLTVPLAPRFSDPAARRLLHRHLQRFFGSDTIDFVAIDGTNDKKTFQDFIVFFACAYGAKGQIGIANEPPSVKYQKWSIDRDVSMVTYIPVPFAEFTDVMDQDRRETFLVSDSDLINLSNIDSRIMELAEVYLAYNVAASSALETPRFIMLDRSPSSMIADVALSPEELPLLGYPYDRRRLTLADAKIALAHPFNPNLGIPSLKKFRQFWAVIAEFHHQRTHEINLAEFCHRHSITQANLRSAIDYLTREDERQESLCRIETRQGVDYLVTSVNVRDSWAYVVSLFENICRKLFLEKDQTALLYEAPDDNGVMRFRWMSPDDIRFLIAIGIRALIEKCWERKILLTGVIKDSTSRYLTRNYLGVMKLLGEQGYQELNEMEVHPLPWTDRIFLELLPIIDETLEAPWSTVEFDSTYMTLHAEESPNGDPVIAGVKQYIVAPERLFARSLAQFFLKRDKLTPLAGHVVFIDRLVFPEWDSAALNQIEIKTSQLGRMQPLCYRTNGDTNIGQALNMYLLDILTRNHFPEVIGYPDPLHKADWGAKSVKDRASKMIASSVHSFRSQPLSRTFRDIRDSFKR